MTLKVSGEFRIIQGSLFKSQDSDAGAVWVDFENNLPNGTWLADYRLKIFYNISNETLNGDGSITFTYGGVRAVQIYTTRTAGITSGSSTNYQIYNYDNSEATIGGTQSDIDLSLYAIDISHNAMDAAWKKYMHSDEYEDYIYDGYSRSQIRRDFNKGFALQIIDLVKAMQADKDALRVQTSSCTALIVRKQHEVSTEYKRLFPNAKSHTSRISTLLTGAVNAGREEGSKVRFNRGISQNIDNTEKIGVRN